MTLQERVGQTIIDERKAQGMSQEKFAYEAEIDRRYMSDIENGRRNISLDILERICSTLHLSLSDFFAKVEKVK